MLPLMRTLRTRRHTFSLLTKSSMLSRVPTKTFHVHGKLCILLFAFVPEAWLFHLRILHACVAEKEVQ